MNFTYNEKLIDYNYFLVSFNIREVYLTGLNFILKLPSLSFLFFLHFKLLNEKNDDEDEETRTGLKKRNAERELLQQLMKDQNEERKFQEQQVNNFYISCVTSSNMILFRHQSNILYLSKENIINTG